MRYYNIVITDTSTSNVIQPNSSTAQGAGYTYSSFVGGKTLSAALNVEMDILSAPLGAAMPGSYVRVWGISLQEISQASDLNGKKIVISGGFQAGLPLANPKQAGILVEGSVLQAFGNWIGTDMTLDLIIGPPIGDPYAPKNIVLDWKANTSLSDAITTTLKTAFPDYTVAADISGTLVRSDDQPGYYESTHQFATYIKQLSRDMLGGTYPGVDIKVDGMTIKVYDNTSPPSPIKIEFQELIGQPTWIGPQELVFKCPMRADIHLGDIVSMPKTQVTTTAAAQSNLSNLKASFQGNFKIQSIRHIGNYRQSSAEGWVTVFNAAAIPGTSNG